MKLSKEIHANSLFGLRLAKLKQHLKVFFIQPDDILTEWLLLLCVICIESVDFFQNGRQFLDPGDTRPNGYDRIWTQFSGDVKEGDD